LKRKLLGYFEDDIKELEQIIGRPLDLWRNNC